MSKKLAYKTNFKIDFGPLTLDSLLKKTLYYTAFRLVIKYAQF